MAYEKEKKTAVALEYTPGEQAPKVIASGRGYLADKIIDVAKEENVPIHKDEKLARSLSVLDIGEYIPPTKIKRICKTSQFYLWEHKLPEDTPVRYDVVFIIGDECRLVRDAFSFFG